MNLRVEEELDELAPNLTPMIDVVFQLLLFFMLATTFQDPERELEVELPHASSGRTAEKPPEELVINVLRDGAVVLGGESLDPPRLARALARAAERDPATPVTIRGDRAAQHASIVGVLDACGSAGLRNLSVGTIEGR